MASIRLATRGSAQATTQAEAVAGQLRSLGYDTELVLIDTHGDRTQATEVPLHTIGGQGVFAKEVQHAVLDGRADAAVHSAKDLPTDGPAALTIGAFTRRRSPGDVLIGGTLANLPAAAVVATGSVRRRAQLGRARPDLEFAELRGNIHTRLDRIPTGGAIVMAEAALEVLGLTDRIDERLDPAEFVPAVGQGCVAVECRVDDGHTGEALARIDDVRTRSAVLVERAFLAELGSGCSLPIGAYSTGAQLHCFLAGEHRDVFVSETIELSGEASGDVERAAAAARSAREFVAGS